VCARKGASAGVPVPGGRQLSHHGRTRRSRTIAGALDGRAWSPPADSAGTYGAAAARDVDGGRKKQPNGTPDRRSPGAGSVGRGRTSGDGRCGGRIAAERIS